MVQALAEAPFKTTFGNVRIEDRKFARANKDEHGSEVEEWIDKGLKEEKDYTSSQPFKLRHFPMGSDGVMKPAKEGARFTGKKVALIFPWGGSSADQFASMIVDNPDAGIHSIGMTMGGYSNTWEWSERLRVPLVGRVRFEWSIGHTLRPNGEILEGNPARAKQWVAITPENVGSYFQALIRAGVAHVTE